MKKIKDTKIKCSCGCGQTLYLADFGDGDVVIGHREDAKKSFKNFSGVILKRKDLLTALKLTE